eukprot:GHRQ01037396.1.p2 GENE.GHRQ01037396.1~~GHRQ01037396.1.p2  ORF type:complete len:105 (-),score=46.72 GHRQ01037396.1:32-346(-)
MTSIWTLLQSRCAAVAAAGLEDQLLGKLILKEKHELEEQRQQLLEEVQSYKKKIKQLEDDLLFRSARSWRQLVGFVKHFWQYGGLSHTVSASSSAQAQNHSAAW